MLVDLVDLVLEFLNRAAKAPQQVIFIENDGPSRDRRRAQAEA
jgi:hypothetical protein